MWMRRRRLGTAMLAALPPALLVLAPAGASAHSLHGEVDAALPLPAYLLGAAAAVALSFAFAAISDDTPPRERPPGRLRVLPGWARLGLRLVGLTAWSWVVLQAIAGGDSDAEVASLILWLFGWVGLALASALLGPVWTWLDPFATLFDLLTAPWRRGPAQPHTGGGAQDRAGRDHVPSDSASARDDPGRRAWPVRLSAWPAVAFLGFFVWLELVARVEGGRSLGLVLVAYTLVTLAGMAWFGRHPWRERAEVFSVWFGLLGRLAPYGLEGPADEGRLRRRGFGSALARGPWSDALLVLVAVGAGSVIWDGVSQTRPFSDLLGRPGLLVSSLLLAAFLAGLAWLVLRVARAVGPAAMGAGLVPVTTGYIVAHYLGFLLVEGQRLVVAASDPLQQGWDLFGTATWEPRDDWLSTSLLWTVQVVAIVLGHVAGAWLGHGAVRRERREGRTVSQWPLAVLMVALTVLALWSLGQNLDFVGGAEPVASSQGAVA